MTKAKDTTPSIRGQYERQGVKEFYAHQGESYRNPHESAVRTVLRAGLSRWPVDFEHVLDLACGSGEVTLLLNDLGYTQVTGVDPYTGSAYLERTGRPAEPFSFEDIAGGSLAGRHYSLIICSYALHLIAASRLPVVCYQLSQIAPALVVVTPHKRPQIKASWGWRLADELYLERTRARYYLRAETADFSINP